MRGGSFTGFGNMLKGKRLLSLLAFGVVFVVVQGCSSKAGGVLAVTKKAQEKKLKTGSPEAFLAISGVDPTTGEPAIRVGSDLSCSTVPALDEASAEGPVFREWWAGAAPQSEFKLISRSDAKTFRVTNALAHKLIKCTVVTLKGSEYSVLYESPTVEVADSRPKAFALTASRVGGNPVSIEVLPGASYEDADNDKATEIRVSAWPISSEPPVFSCDSDGRCVATWPWPDSAPAVIAAKFQVRTFGSELSGEAALTLVGGVAASISPSDAAGGVGSSGGGTASGTGDGGSQISDLLEKESPDGVGAQLTSVARIILQNCPSATLEDSSLGSCPLATAAEVAAGTRWELSPQNTCSWLSVSGTAGGQTLVGTPANRQVGTCTLSLVRKMPGLPDETVSVSHTVINVAPSWTIGTPADGLEDQTLEVSGDVVQTSDEGDGAGSTYAFVDNPGNNQRCSLKGSLSDLDAATGAFRFTPDTDWNGTCSVGVSFTDGQTTIQTTLNLTIQAADEAALAPLVVGSQTVQEDAVLVVSGAAVAHPDEGTSGASYQLDSALVTGTACADHGLVIMENPLTGAHRFLPDLNFNGVCSVGLVFAKGTAQVTTTYQVTVSAVNDAPAPPAGVSLTPASPDSSQDVTCAFSPGAGDPDGDALTPLYFWYQNGSLVGGQTGMLLPSGVFDRSDTILCRVALSDGTAISPLVSSSSATVRNAPPSAPSVTITSPSTSVKSVPQCVASGSADNDPADTISYAFSWQRNGVVVAGATQQWLDVSAFAPGDSISCQAIASDGSDISDPVLSGPLVLQNLQPSARIAPIATPFSDGVTPLVVTVDGTQSTDPDGDALTFLWSTNDAAAVVSAAASPSPDITIDGSLLGSSFTLTLSVDDGTNAPVTTSLVVPVLGNNPVVADFFSGSGSSGGSVPDYSSHIFQHLFSALNLNFDDDEASFGLGVVDNYQGVVRGVFVAPSSDLYRMEWFHDDAGVLNLSGLSSYASNDWTETLEPLWVYLEAGQRVPFFSWYSDSGGGGAGTALSWSPGNSGTAVIIPASQFPREDLRVESLVFDSPTAGGKWLARAGSTV